MNTFRPTWDAAITERKIFLPLLMNGKPMFDKNGKPIKFPVVIRTVTVTVKVEHGTFTLTATSRGQNIADGSRRPLPMVAADLRRLFAKPDAAGINAYLEKILPPLRASRPKSAAPVGPMTAEHTAARAAAVQLRDKRAKADAEQLAARHKPAPAAKPQDFAAMSARQFAAFNRKAAKASAETAAAGKLVRVHCHWPGAFRQAQELAGAHSCGTGCRSLDTLHCAVALQLGPLEFLSTDTRQMAVAAATGLTLARAALGACARTNAGDERSVPLPFPGS